MDGSQYTPSPSEHKKGWHLRNFHFREKPMRCPRCSSENMIPLDWSFFRNVFRIKVLKKKPADLNIKYQIPTRSDVRCFLCLDCYKFYTQYIYDL